MSRRSYQTYNDQGIQKVTGGLKETSSSGGSSSNNVAFEKIVHISGSCAGASSSAFDVYRGGWS